ncbi:MAG: hypothetical protein ACO1SV_25075 [Fimbriimonas sp.]
MRYFVIGDQGQKYGPSDTAGLNQWIGEGRLLPTTILEEETSGMRSAASAVPGLQFAPAAPPAYPMGTHATAHTGAYTPPTYSEEGIGPALLGIGLGLLSPIVTYFIGIGGLICFTSGLGASWRVKDERPALAYAGLALNVGAGVFWLYWRIIRQY